MPSQMDHVADVKNGGVELHRLYKLYDFPDFVKSAQPDKSLEVPRGTQVTACADPVRKQFWCHTKAACWLSHLFYHEKKAEFHPNDRAQIEKRLNAYAASWDIKAACDAIVARWSELHKAADDNLPDSAFAYVWTGNDGTKVRQYPLRSAMEVKAAAEWLHRHRDVIPFKTRHVMAGKILEKAASFGAGIKDHVEFLEKQAGRGVCEPSEVVSLIEKRAYLVPEGAGVTFDDDGKPSGGLRAHFLKMAKTVKDLPRVALQADMLVKLADTLDTLDRQLGVVGKYSDIIQRPEDVIFKATFNKVASELASHVATTSGNLYEKEAFKKLSVEDVEALFGSDFVSQVRTPLGGIDPEKMAEEVATLPRPDAQLLDNLLSENGIIPAMRKAASAKQGLTSAQMEQIAAQYMNM